jgi:D-glycero-beta-D-manno-heptose 1-phosphate adenylyltransferase
VGLISSINEINRENKILVTTNGSFDVLHTGHLRILQEAKKNGDILLLLLNSDKSVKLNKGEKRPIIPESERAEMLLGLGCVDHVLLFDDKEVINTLKEIKPDIHIKGGTYIPKRVQGEKELIESWGGKHICLGMRGNNSTTDVIRKILEVHK